MLPCLIKKIVFIDWYRGPTNIKQFNWLINDYDQGDRSQQRGGGGNINTTSAITEVQFKFSSGNINAGKVKMYGMV